MTIRWLLAAAILAFAGAAFAAEIDTDAAARETPVAPSPPPDVPCVGVKEARVYHRLDCRALEGMGRADCEFFPSCANAIERGYNPCPLCRPPVIGRHRRDPREPKVERPFTSGSKRMMRVRGTPVAGRWFLVPVRKPWISTRMQVAKGQVLCIQAGGRITLRPGTATETIWSPDGLNRRGRPSSSWGWRRKYYLQGRLAGKTFRAGRSHFGIAPKSGILELGIRCGSGDREKGTGMFKVFVAVFEPGAELVAPGKAASGPDKTLPATRGE